MYIYIYIYIYKSSAAGDPDDQAGEQVHVSQPAARLATVGFVWQEPRPLQAGQSCSWSQSNGWALCPAWFPKVSLAAQHVIYVAVGAPARP